MVAVVITATALGLVAGLVIGLVLGNMAGRKAAATDLINRLCD